MDKCGKPALAPAALDALVRLYTAFACWADMESSLRAGYVPTLYRARSGRERQLVREVRGRGYRVYTGR
jgi:hypothetical protein